MQDIDELHREYGRVRIFSCFDSSQRIWWIYLREAVERWLERNEHPEIRAAYDRLHALPEHLPDERARWHDLRAAVERVLVKQSAP